MNLVLTVVHGLEYPAIAPFFESYAAARSDSQMHAFVAGISPGSMKKIGDTGAITHPFRYLSFRRRQPLLYAWPLWRRMLANRDFEGKCALGRRVFHLFALRSILYHDFLTEHGHEFENVLVTDCRDVFFQRDPFSDNLGPGLHCFLEAKTQTIGGSPANSVMMRGSFGPETLAELADKRVSCAGTVMGDVESMRLYLRHMVELSAAGPTMFGGSDQGVHNFIVHRGKVPGVHVHDNYDSTVFTGGCEAEQSYRWNAKDEIVRDDGQPYPVLHQHDRYPAVTKRLHAKLNL
ncbi:MAG TPA: hypothetical protein VG733_01120 [Chthoniobacteraceae bacterium]|nr:hypothetical protein [Chthoniobacteraceae bacterium]